MSRGKPEPLLPADRVTATSNLDRIQREADKAFTGRQVRAAFRAAEELTALVADRRRPWLAGLRP